jgi:hypothetical protein
LPFWRLVNDPRFAGVPGILETPSGPDGKPSFARNLERLRALAGAPRPDAEGVGLAPPLHAPTSTTKSKRATTGASAAAGSLTRMRS